jgi:hypothetical protein
LNGSGLGSKLSLSILWSRETTHHFLKRVRATARPARRHRRPPRKKFTRRHRPERAMKPDAKPEGHGAREGRAAMRGVARRFSGVRRPAAEVVCASPIAANVAAGVIAIRT